MEKEISNILPCDKPATIIAKVITFDEPNINGRIYKKENFMENFESGFPKGKPVYYYEDNMTGYECRPEKWLGHLTDYKIDGNDLVCEFKACDRDSLPEFFDYVNSDKKRHRVVLNSIGTVDENNVVDVSRVCSFSIQYIGG
jgi:hypothetical protein